MVACEHDRYRTVPPDEPIAYQIHYIESNLTVT